MQTVIEVDFDRFFRWLDKVDQSLTNNPAAWRAMAFPYYGFVTEIFRKQGSPKWKELAQSTKNQRSKVKGKRSNSAHIGIVTGGMHASVTGSAAGSVLQFGPNYLFLGSSLKRTLWFHSGTTNAHGRQQQPPRPIFVPPDARTSRDMLDAFLTVARRAIR